jgi:hypothetical protein
MLDAVSGDFMQVLQDAADLAEDFAGLGNVHAGLGGGGRRTQEERQ